MTAKAKPDETVVDGTTAEDAEDFKPTPGELVVRPDVPEDVYRAMDAADEAQILDALMGKPSEKLVYRFRGSDGKDQTGLSYEGVAEVVREMNATPYAQIRIAKDFTPIVKEVSEENEHGEVITYFDALVYAEDVHNGGGNFGTARQAKFQTFKDKAKKPRLDSFATAKALSKAQRNAMKPLTPVEWRESLIAKHLNNPARVKELRLGMGDATAELPPPLDDDEAKALIAEAREVYAELRQLLADPMSYAPGLFHVHLSRAEHSHDRLRDFVAYLRSEVEKAGDGAEKPVRTPETGGAK